MIGKQPLVLLPGTLCTELTFQHQVTHLDDICNPLVLPLQRGTTPRETAEWILAQAPQQFALAGFSQGAIVAFEMARLAPERLDRLALLDANPLSPREEQLVLWERWRRQARDEGLSEIIGDMISAGVHPGRRHDLWLCAAIEQMAIATGVDAFIRQLEGLTKRIDSRPSLVHITCPTLLLVGRQDGITPLEFHEEMASLLPHVTLLPIEDSGHYSPMEQPQAVTAALRYWLQAPRSER